LIVTAILSTTIAYDTPTPSLGTLQSPVTTVPSATSIVLDELSAQQIKKRARAGKGGKGGEGGKGGVFLDGSSGGSFSRKEVIPAWLGAAVAGVFVMVF